MLFKSRTFIPLVEKAQERLEWYVTTLRTHTIKITLIEGLIVLKFH